MDLFLLEDRRDKILLAPFAEFSISVDFIVSSGGEDLGWMLLVLGNEIDSQTNQLLLLCGEWLYFSDSCYCCFLERLAQLDGCTQMAF